MKINSTNLFEEFLQLSLKEDLEPCGDLTTEAIFQEKSSNNKLIVSARKQAGIMSGSHFVEKIYQIIDSEIKLKFLIEDGEAFSANAPLVEIEGEIKNILKGERLFLNLLQKAISVATYTSEFVKLIRNTKAKILDTRKTTPCLRALEKAAVLDGGGFNHRFNLATGILIKDNHIALAGGIGEALKKAKQNAPYLGKIEIEIDSLEQLKQALSENLLESNDIILLDNFSIASLKEAISMINQKHLTEASGGVNLQNVSQIAQTGINFISVGSITQSPPPIDIGLDFY